MASAYAIASLRYLINVRIALTGLFILIVGGIIVMLQAKASVKTELTSSLNLAAQLIQLNFPSYPQRFINNDMDQWLSGFVSLEQTRHLTVEFQRADGKVVSFKATNGAADLISVPQLFIDLISADTPVVEKQLLDNQGQSITLIIKADPHDEIAEAWQESCVFFAILTSLVGIIFLVINLVFKSSVGSIKIIVDKLKAIEQGQLTEKLPAFTIEEYNQIASAANHMIDAMIDASNENQALTRQNLKIQEEERRYLAKELHDELGQSLTAIKVMVTASKNSKADSAQIADTILTICDDLIAVVRSMMRQLHPLALSELGLRAGLEDLLSHWSQRFPELEIRLACVDTIDDSMSADLAIHIFRICQEALTNIVRHAEATSAQIRLSAPDSGLLLEISDNGKGYAAPAKQAGFGLLSMAERIQSLGGVMGIETAPNEGMKITATIPFS